METHYTRSYGYGETARQHCLNLQTLLDYAAAGGLDWERFLGHAQEADPARGRPEAELVNLMTIHTAKGLEFDYVLLPECAEGAMPTLVSGGDPTFDAREPRRAPQPAEWLENERRLFYVAATRARRELILAGPDPDPEAKPSRFLEEMEPEATAAIAAELTAAMAGRANRLAEVLRQWNDQHSIVRLVKQAYSRDLPPGFCSVLLSISVSYPAWDTTAENPVSGKPGNAAIPAELGAAVRGLPSLTLMASRSSRPGSTPTPRPTKSGRRWICILTAFPIAGLPAIWSNALAGILAWQRSIAGSGNRPGKRMKSCGR